jgi:stage II sporulation protein D
VQEAFKTAVARPYLRSVSDAREYGGYFSDVSPRFQWREEWDGASLRSILSTTLAPYMNVGAAGLPRITNIQVTGTTHSGRVSELRIGFDQGEVRIPGPDVRNVLRPTPDRMLGSAMFQLDVKIEGGEVTHLVATGVGWGHGVGFCQWGAIGRARAGADAARILAAYFPGTKIERLY